MLVTGAGSGIGRAVSRLFLRRGWNVALVGRRPAPLAETAAGHVASLVVPADVTQLAAAEAAVSETVGRFGRLDVLFNNAGIFPKAGLVDEIDPDDWARAVAVNLTGAFYCARAAFAAMRRQSPQGGRIINNGSISSQSPRPGSAPYTATKHAVTGLTKTLALDGRPFDIAAGQIDIGNAETELAAGFGQGAMQADGSVRPEPMMQLDDVAEAVWYMAGLPLSANVPFMTVMATKMPLIGRG